MADKIVLTESDGQSVVAQQNGELVGVLMTAETAAKTIESLRRWVPFNGAPELMALWDALGGLPLLADTEAVA